MSNRVVVTGLGALTPVGNNIKDFWDGIVDGKNGIAPISYFDTSDFKCKLAAELKNYNPLEKLDKNTVRKTDRFVQYGLIAVKEAMEDSRLEGNIAAEDLAVYFGTGIGGFNTFCSEHASYLEKGPLGVAPQFISKMIVNIAAGNIAIKYNAKNACTSVVTACASGTSSIGEAYRAIKHGYTKAAICGGTEATITPLAVAAFTNCMALSTSDDSNAASLPFDKRRGGFVMGEGAAALILEEYSHAKARGAKIYAEVIGYGSTCDAYHVTAPDTEAISSARAVSDALKDTEITDYTKVYMNAHGTGTPFNDKCETLAVKNALGEENARMIHISSTKSMTGHMMGAAGAAEACVAVLSIVNGVVPPTINLSEPDEECDLNYTPDISKKTEIELAFSTSFGFGGHNACIAFKKI